MATPVSEDKIYVAVGKDVKESKAKLVWTAHQSRGNVKICIIHVLVPSQRIPIGGLGAGIPASSANEKMLREHREKERINMHNMLNILLRVCEQMGVRAEKEYIQAKSVEMGIVELISLHGIRKLVMGAASDNRYFRETTEIKSKKAIFIRDKAPISCQIWFICDGRLIHSRKAQMVQAVAEVSSDAPLPMTPSPEAEKPILSRSQSATPQGSGTTRLSSSFQEILRGATSSNADGRAVMPMASPSPYSTPSPQRSGTTRLSNSFQEILRGASASNADGRAVVPMASPSPYSAPSPQRSDTTRLSSSFQEILRGASPSNADGRAVMSMVSPSPVSTPSPQPNSASTLESQGAFEDLRQFSRSLSQHLYLTQSFYHTGHSSPSYTLDMNENDGREVLEKEVTTCAEAEVDVNESGPKDPGKRKYLNRLYTEKLEEELETVKGRLDKVMEELHIALDQKSQLESQFIETDQSKKELQLKIISTDEMLRTYRQERELLRMDLENALQKAEDVSRGKADSSSTRYFSEYAITEIKEAAQNFDPSLKIGEGGCGSVYRGFLRHTHVAIKTMKFPSRQGSQEFQQEVDVLSKVRHPNLITLIGACPEPCTLVYEYIPNGSLEDWLRSSNRAKQLPWRARIRIATELCSVLAFLHSCKPHSIVHGDVKPGNILLDVHLVSKLSDFGICRLLSREERSSNDTTAMYITDPKGTLGYMDPEFLVTRELSTKFDVYSFGIILLQLLTRRPALGIANEVQKAINAGTLGAILDPLAGEWPFMLAQELTHLALKCCEMSRRNRPDLRVDVWTLLQSIGPSCQ